MCDICNSLFGHLPSCPEQSSKSGTYCFWCENKLEADTVIVTLPSGLIVCKECINDFDLSDLLTYLDVDSIFELIEKYDICETETLGRFR